MGSYLNFNPSPSPSPYTYNRGGNNNPYLNPSNNPEPRMTTLAMGEEGGGGYNSFPFTGGFNPQPYQFNGGGFNFMPFPAQYNPNPQMTTYAMGEEGGGGYNPQPFPFPYNPNPQMTTFAMGEEGGWSDNGGDFLPPPEPPTPPVVDIVDTTNADKVKLSTAQKVHKDADKADGKVDGSATEAQLKVQQTKLKDQVKKLETDLATATRWQAPASVTDKMKTDIAAAKKELDAANLMVANSSKLSTTENGKTTVKYGNLSTVAGKVTETGGDTFLSKEDIAKVTDTVVDTTNADKVKLSTAQKVHKDADKADGKVDGSATEAQLKVQQTKLKDQVKKLETDLATATRWQAPASVTDKMKTDIAAAKKELDAANLMVANSSKLSTTENGKTTVKYGNLSTVAGKVTETGGDTFLSKEDIAKVTDTVVDTTNADKVKLSTAQKVHKDADKADGKVDGSATEAQLKVQQTKLKDQVKKLETDLATATRWQAPASVTDKMKTDIAAAKKELDAANLMVDNKSFFGKTVNGKTTFGYDELDTIAKRVTESGGDTFLSFQDFRPLR